MTTGKKAPAGTQAARSSKLQNIYNRSEMVVKKGVPNLNESL